MSWSQQHWELIWVAARDVLLTGTGMVLLLSQVFSGSPSSQLLEAGLALTVPSIIGHARVLLGSGSGTPASPSSPSSPPSGPSPSGSSPEAADGQP